jgi:hypothetical protein
MIPISLPSDEKSFQMIPIPSLFDKKSFQIEPIPSLPDEKFHKIKNYDNYYISDLGRLYNSNSKRFNKGTIMPTGYVYVYLSKNAVSKKVALHRIVAEHFIPNPEQKQDVNHLGAKTDNRACMLE